MGVSPRGPATNIATKDPLAAQCQPHSADLRRSALQINSYFCLDTSQASSSALRLLLEVHAPFQLADPLHEIYSVLDLIETVARVLVYLKPIYNPPFLMATLGRGRGLKSHSARRVATLCATRLPAPTSVRASGTKDTIGSATAASMRISKPARTTQWTPPCSLQHAIQNSFPPVGGSSRSFLASDGAMPSMSFSTAANIWKYGMLPDRMCGLSIGNSEDKWQALYGRSSKASHGAKLPNLLRIHEELYESSLIEIGTLNINSKVMYRQLRSHDPMGRTYGTRANGASRSLSQARCPLTEFNAATHALPQPRHGARQPQPPHAQAARRRGRQRHIPIGLRHPHPQQSPHQDPQLDRPPPSRRRARQDISKVSLSSLSAHSSPSAGVLGRITLLR